MNQRAINIGLASLLLASNAAEAQEVQSPSTIEKTNFSDENSCNIELWVAKRYGVDGSSGAGAALFGLLGALVEAAANSAGDKEKKTEMMEIIPPEFIKETFLSTDLTTRLKKDYISINYHELSDDKVQLKNLLDTKTRSSSSQASCYYEVFVKSIQASQYLGSKSLIVVFKLKKFSGASAVKLENETRLEKLKVFPTSKEEKKSEAADDLKATLKVAVEKFVQKRIS